MAEHSLATASIGVWGEGRGEVRGEVKGWGGGGKGERCKAQFCLESIHPRGTGSV